MGKGARRGENVMLVSSWILASFRLRTKQHYRLDHTFTTFGRNSTIGWIIHLRHLDETAL